MSVTFSETNADLFAEHPDLARLLGALRRARGFALYFARCNSPSYRRRLVDALLPRLERPVFLFDLDDGSTTSLDARVENAVKEADPESVVFIFELEHFLPSGNPERQAQTLSELNWRRGAFARLESPLVFWLPEWALNLVATGAPDFYDWYSGVYEFHVSEPVRYEQFDAALAATDSQEAVQRLTIEEKRRWATVLKELIDEADNDSKGNSHIVSRLLNQFGTLSAEMGDYEDARPAFERALKIEEAVFGGSSSEVAVAMHNYAIVLQNLGDNAGARAALERALAIDEAVHGSNHPNVATDSSSLGLILHEIGDLIGAKNYIERAKQIDEAIFGLTHPKLAADLTNLGMVLLNAGNAEEARALFDRAVKIDEAAYGSDHIAIASIETNLGNALRVLGDYQGAHTAYEHALLLCRKFLGESHPKTALVQRNLSRLLNEFQGA